MHEACVGNVLLKHECMHHLGVKRENIKRAVKSVKRPPVLANLNCSKLSVQYTKLLLIVVVTACLIFPSAARMQCFDRRQNIQVSAA